jgi:hypothetical protein
MLYKVYMYMLHMKAMKEIGVACKIIQQEIRKYLLTHASKVETRIPFGLCHFFLTKDKLVQNQQWSTLYITICFLTIDG